MKDFCQFLSSVLQTVLFSTQILQEHQNTTIMIIPPTIFLFAILSSSSSPASDCDSYYMHQFLTQSDQKFEQRNNRFWEFNEQSNSWTEVPLPYDVVSCSNNNCTVVHSIRGDGGGKREEERDNKSPPPALKRRTTSLTRMSDTSVWVIGQSGAVYERFWNGAQWVIAPHDLPPSAGCASSVFMVNQSIIALSRDGLLYLMQLTEDSQPIWVEFHTKETEIRASLGVVSEDRERMYFCTSSGLLLELLGIDPPRWKNHGRPPGANVTAVSDGDIVRQGLLLIISAAGDLYEYDKNSKPPWKKHIRSRKDTSLASLSPCSAVAPHYISLFLLTKNGELIERRLHRKKWKWVVHGSPKDHLLTSITCTSNQNSNSNSNSLLVTTASGSVFEYRTQKNEGIQNWTDHNHPPNAKLAIGIPGLHLQEGRTIFPLDDGRLAELHLSGFGGESFGPNAPITTRRKTHLKYVWSFLDAPESEGWNEEYCNEERGPHNCIVGTKDETTESSVSRWRKDSKIQQTYLTPQDSGGGDYKGVPDELNPKLFRLRLMQGGKSFFLITDNYMTFEYLNTENAWFWLRHEHSTGIHGALGNYNGSLFVVDEYGSLMIRERSSSDLAWINCTSMRRGKPVIGGPPWDGIPGQPVRAKPEDAIFFLSRTGKLLQFTVALRKFKWKDCKNPADIKIASIVDQEGFRENIVFVVGKNGRLYQYNKVTQVWHQHYQSQHLVLSRSPGTAMRPSIGSLRGSLFMLSEDGGLVEYQWSPTDGWNWIEHGTPHTSVALVGAPGPCFGGTHLFLIGSNGNVYLRYLEQEEWKWRHCGFPFLSNKVECKDTDCFHHIEEKSQAMEDHCNPKVSPTRPIPFSDDTAIFELQDGRLGEMRRMEDKNWMWLRIIGTPTSLCMANFWTSWAT